ncbi:hypothetical protein ACJZ2D_007650 [Fusarium nematophilum]
MEHKEQLEFPVVESTVVIGVASTTALLWLTYCRSSHLQCNHPRLSAKGWHPTRLLDVGEEGCTAWRLCVTSEDAISPPSASYLTLSYRWGPNPRIRLLSSNVASLRQGRPIDDLPVLFRDIIDVARWFSIRYVWIDALCIIQDSKEDWEREAPTMQHVYSNSACTLAASGSESPDDGLFHERSLNFIRPGKVECSLFSDEPQSSTFTTSRTGTGRSLKAHYTIEAGSSKNGFYHREFYISVDINFSGSVGLSIAARSSPKAYRATGLTKKWTLSLNKIMVSRRQCRWGHSIFGTISSKNTPNAT